MIDLDDMNAVIAALEESLQALPGSSAQEPMSPLRGDSRGAIPPDARPSAVLLLLFPKDGSPHLVLTKRAHTVEHHKGQISMPGGMMESGESPREAALREAEEEIGVDRSTVTVLGPLSPLYIPVSGFVLYPLVGALSKAVPWRPAESEVDAILTPSLCDLGDPENRRIEVRTVAGETRPVPYFSLEREKIWGATAMVLSEFMALLGVAPGGEEA